MENKILFKKGIFVHVCRMFVDCKWLYNFMSFYTHTLCNKEMRANGFAIMEKAICNEHIGRKTRGAKKKSRN